MEFQIPVNTWEIIKYLPDIDCLELLDIIFFGVLFCFYCRNELIIYYKL